MYWYMYVCYVHGIDHRMGLHDYTKKYTLEDFLTLLFLFIVLMTERFRTRKVMKLHPMPVKSFCSLEKEEQRKTR